MKDAIKALHGTCDALSQALEDMRARKVQATEERDDYKAKWAKLMAAIGPYSTTDLAAKMAESARLQISEERERCAKIVEGKISTSGPIGIASFELLPIIAKEIRAGVPLKQNPETKGE